MKYDKERQNEINLKSVIQHSFTNGSVLMILGSLVIGLIADTKQAEGIKPFTTDIFKGFLAIFLLEMGMVTARRFSAFMKYGLYVSLFAIIIPAINGCVVAYLSLLILETVLFLPFLRQVLLILLCLQRCDLQLPKQILDYMFPWHLV
jgi:uncharacterized protein